MSHIRKRINTVKKCVLVFGISIAAFMSGCGGSSFMRGPGARENSTASGSEGWERSRLDLKVQSVETFLDSLGMSVHFVGSSEREIRLLREAGIRHVRDEIAWAWAERVQGRLRMPTSRSEWIDHAALNGIDVLLILDYSNPIYMYQGIGNRENPEAEFEAFGRYVDFMLTELGDKVGSWEIWNEPNAFFFDDQYGGDWRGGGWVDAYARLANAMERRIHALDPGARVLTAGMEAPIAELVVPKLDGDFDGIAVHPYCHPLLPEYAAAGMAQLRETADRAGLSVPLIVTEQGYPTVGGVGKFMWNHSATITLEDQARFLLRVFCGNFARGIPRTYWYDFVCDGPDPENPEHNFGIVNMGAESTRPAYDALKTLTTMLGRSLERDASPAAAVLDRGASIEMSPPLSAPARGLLLARDSAHYFLVLWKESDSKDPLVVNGENGEARVFHDDGAPERVRLSIPAFSAGRLVARSVDPMLGMESERELRVTSDGIQNMIEVEVKESPVVVEMVFE